MLRPRACAVVVAACVGAHALAARADAPSLPGAHVSPPRLAAPFVLPELSHPRTDVALDFTLGRGVANGAERKRVVAGIVRAAAEGHILGERRLYAGVTWDWAAALPPDAGIDDETTTPSRSGRTAALGNVEPHLRAAFPLTPGLLAGFVFGFVLPTASIERAGPAPSAMRAAASIAPTDLVHFLPGHFALRPAGDVRIVRGPFVFQARQGFDIMIDEAGIERTRTAGRLLAHVGVAPSRALEVGLEATQIYFFFTEGPPGPIDPSVPASERAALERRNALAERYRISDDRRTALTFGPTLRLSFPHVDVGAAVITNLFAPLSPSLESLFALRLSLVLHFR